MSVPGLKDGGIVDGRYKVLSRLGSGVWEKSLFLLYSFSIFAT